MALGILESSELPGALEAVPDESYEPPSRRKVSIRKKELMQHIGNDMKKKVKFLSQNVFPCFHRCSVHRAEGWQQTEEIRIPGNTESPVARRAVNVWWTIQNILGSLRLVFEGLLSSITWLVPGKLSFPLNKENVSFLEQGWTTKRMQVKSTGNRTLRGTKATVWYAGQHWANKKKLLGAGKW